MSKWRALIINADSLSAFFVLIWPKLSWTIPSEPFSDPAASRKKTKTLVQSMHFVEDQSKIKKIWFKQHWMVLFMLDASFVWPSFLYLVLDQHQRTTKTSRKLKTNTAVGSPLIKNLVKISQLAFIPASKQRDDTTPTQNTSERVNSPNLKQLYMTSMTSTKYICSHERTTRSHGWEKPVTWPATPSRSSPYFEYKKATPSDRFSALHTVH